MSGTKPYRPSNFIEAMAFNERYCVHCRYDEADGDPCVLFGLATLFSIGDPDYPAEWITGGGAGPRCTAFSPIDGLPPPPADLSGQLVLFNERDKS
jgi:hypothetical protein